MWTFSFLLVSCIVERVVPAPLLSPALRQGRRSLGTLGRHSKPGARTLDSLPTPSAILLGQTGTIPSVYSVNLP